MLWDTMAGRFRGRDTRHYALCYHLAVNPSTSRRCPSAPQISPARRIFPAGGGALIGADTQQEVQVKVAAEGQPREQCIGLPRRRGKWAYCTAPGALPATGLPTTGGDRSHLDESALYQFGTTE